MTPTLKGVSTGPHGLPFTYLLPTDPELERAWDAFAGEGERYQPALDRCPCCAEEWHYIVTARDGQGRWAHSFVHAHHPDFGRRIYVTVPAARGWEPRGES